MMKQRQKNKHETGYKKIEKYSDDEEHEENELSIKTKPQKRELQTVDKLVEDGDTLQSLAIRYRCTIEDLKRLNNIHKENEVFAKRTIKVPHHPISQALAEVHLSGRTSPHQPSASIDMDTARLTDTLATLSGQEVNQIIFNSSLSQKVEAHREENEIDEEEEQVRLLPQSYAQVPVASALRFNGADCDISIKALVLCIVIVIFAIPLIYVFYIAEHPEQYNHQQHGS